MTVLEMIDQAIGEHQSELQRLQAARAALVGQTKKVVLPTSTNVVPIRTLSTAAKKRISDAAKKRWAVARAAGRNSLRNPIQRRKA